MRTFLRLLLLNAALLASVQSFAEEVCEVYPLALPSNMLKAGENNTPFNKISLRNGYGNFSWLTWNGNNNTNTLASSLVPPGNSQLYKNPYDSGDTSIDIGDWVQGVPGVKNGKEVRNNLDALIGKDITIPLWSQRSGRGSKYNYLVDRFAIIEITDYKLNGKGWISFIYKDTTDCQEITNTPPVAQNNTVTTGEDEPVNIKVLAIKVMDWTRRS